jgi:mannose-6-phosphate isomerase-like protein (cupin superfamily)
MYAPLCTRLDHLAPAQPGLLAAERGLADIQQVRQRHKAQEGRLISTLSASDLCVLGNTFLAKGGPAPHLHYEQEEWFSILAGTFLFEVGAERFSL